jgi:membrane fusion protein (multidrug efflux system)
VLTAPAAGIVQELQIEVGQRVHRHQLLMTLDVPELDARSKALAAAAATAQSEATRQKDLLSQGITSQRQYDEAVAAATSAREEAQAARRLNARTRITAPIAGGVQRVAVQPGERVDVGAVLLSIISSDTVDLMAAVPAEELGRIHTGNPAMVSAEGDSTQARGRVRAIAPGVDSATGSGWVVIRIPNPTGLLRPGAGASATIQLGVRKDVLVVPDAALVVVGDSLTVFVVGADSTVSTHTVTVTTRTGGRAEVRSDGLSAGSVVVTQGAYGLENGMHVVPSGRP